MNSEEIRKFGKNIWMGFAPVMYNISPVLQSKILYRMAIGKRLDLQNPKSINEKLMWLKLNWYSPLVSKCADKYGVREYVEQSGYKDILPKIYGIYDNVEDIPWDKLPKKYALKCTHGCGYNIICDGNVEIDIEDAKRKLSKWMKKRYACEAAEIHYDRIKPRIICEEYIETSAGLLPIDYKIYCFNGEPKTTLVCTERAIEMKKRFMDLDWNEMHIGVDKFLSTNYLEKPESYDEMIKICRKLAKPFPFVRIDFYDLNGRPVLGEMTFTANACIGRFYNECGDKMLGDMLKLPKKCPDIKYKEVYKEIRKNIQ